jgi:hypothetical protein
MNDGFRRMGEEIKEIRFSDVGGRQEIILLEG